MTRIQIIFQESLKIFHSQKIINNYTFLIYADKFILIKQLGHCAHLGTKQVHVMAESIQSLFSILYSESLAMTSGVSHND